MTKDELISFLKENLSLDFIKESGMYNSPYDLHTLKLKLCDETISEVFIEIPNVGYDG